MQDGDKRERSDNIILIFNPKSENKKLKLKLERKIKNIKSTIFNSNNQTSVFLFLCSQYSSFVKFHSFPQNNTTTFYNQTSNHNPQCLNTAPI